MRSFQWHFKENWRYPQSQDNLLPWSKTTSDHLILWQNHLNILKGSDLHPKDHNIQIFIDASNTDWGISVDQDSVKGLWSDGEKRLHINVPELKEFLVLKKSWNQCQNQTVLIATVYSTVVAHINKWGGTHSVEMCALLWRLMTWCHHYKIALHASHIPACLNVMANKQKGHCSQQRSHYNYQCQQHFSSNPKTKCFTTTHSI